MVVYGWGVQMVHGYGVWVMGNEDVYLIEQWM